MHRRRSVPPLLKFFVCFALFIFLGRLTDCFSVSIETLTDATYSQFFRSHHSIVVKVYAPWCPRSVHLAPQFSTAVDEVATRLHDLAGSVVNVAFAEIDGSSNPSLVSEWNLKSYPVVAIVSQKGSSIQFHNGERTVRSTASALEKLLRA